MNPVLIGPQTVPPENETLGWAVYDWMHKYLLQPDGPKAGEKWVLTDEQLRFVLNWYRIDANGKFVYRSGTYRRMKGAGKNPFAAALCAVELVGPCRFGGRNPDGSPIAVPHFSSWVQTAAVNLVQTRNAMTLLPAMFSPDAVAEYQIDLGKEIIYARKGRCQMQAVTSSPRSLEGGRATFIVMDETHHWLSNNEGHAMADVIARNAAKSRDGASRVLEITNAFAPGEDSVAERSFDAWRLVEQGLSNATDILYDSREAPEEIEFASDEEVRDGIACAAGDSYWLDPDRILAEIRDPRTTPAVAYRFYLNKIHAEEDKPFEKDKWAQCAKSYQVPEGSLITLGFDGSIARDHTALIGTEVESGHQWVVGYWIPEQLPTGEYRIDFLSVDQTMDYAFERWQVWRMYCDPYYWKDMTASWAGKFGEDKVVEWATNQYRRMAIALLNYRNAISTLALTHDGDQRFTACIENSHKQMQNFVDDQGERMWVIQKERADSPLKIDAAVAGCLSWQARTDAIAAGATATQYAGAFFV